MLLVLMIMIVFIAMTTFTLRYVVRQAHETVNQEQEEQAFWAADSGVSYTTWLLAPSGGGYTPDQISGLGTISNHAVRDDLNQQIGSFSLVDIVSGTGIIELRSIGKDITLTNRCQSIAVQLRQLELGEPYVVTKWNHQVGYLCT